MSVTLPAWVYEKEMGRRRAELSRQELHWNPILQALDPRLHLTPPMEHSAIGMKPRRWHISMVNEQGLPLHIPIEGPDGEFSEMTDRHFESLKRADMQSARAMSLARKERERLERSKERANQRIRDDRVSEIAERAEAHESVSMHVKKKVS